MKLQLLLIVAVCCLATANAAEDFASWQSIELGRAGDLTVRLRVKRQASLADVEWLAIEFDNRSGEDIHLDYASYHTESERHDLKTGELVSSGSLASGNDHNLFPQAWKSTPISPRIVKPGVYRVTDHPSLYSSALLGLPKESGVVVKAEISFSMRLQKELVQFNRQKFEFEWLHPTDVEFERMRTRLQHLLATPSNHVQHAYILHALLKIPEVARATSAPKLIAAIALRTHSFTGREYILNHLNEYYSDDDVLINSLLTRLRDDDQRIVADLLHLNDVWTPEFLPLLLQRFENDQRSVRGIFAILRLQGTPQKSDQELATRLSSALNKHSWFDLSDSDQPKESFRVADALQNIGRTHDRKMIPAIVPYLDDKRFTMSPNQGMTFSNFGVPPLRVCDNALEAILKILDGSTDSGYQEAGFNASANARLDATKRVEAITKTRDKMIITLKKRLAL